MADENNESLLSTQFNVNDDMTSIESYGNAKKKRKQFTSIVSIEDNERIDVAINSYRIVQNAFKRRKIQIARVDNVHARTEELHLQIDDLKAALAVEQNHVRILK